MKKFLTLFTLVMAVALTAPHADAKRFGGGKSFGKSFKTAPAKRQQAQPTDTLRKQQPQNMQKSSSKKGMMGGLLGGLLAGGLLAALFSGGAFDGIQFMDILIICILAFIGFKLFRMLRGQKTTARGHKEAYAGGSPQHKRTSQPFGQQTNYGQNGGQSSQSNTGFANDVPNKLPANFDTQGFVNRARDHYRGIQEAWNQNNMSKIREYVSADLYQELVNERNSCDGKQQTQVMFVNADIVRADYNQQLAEISLQFSGRYKETPALPEQDITDIWHLQRDLTTPNSPWLIVGIQG